MAKILDNAGIGVSQQLVNIDPTTIQHPDSVEHFENSHKAYQISDTAHYQISQQLSDTQGEREGVESVPPNGVLQIPVGRELGKGETECSCTCLL
jgi:hypothetical protein